MASVEAAPDNPLSTVLGAQQALQPRVVHTYQTQNIEGQQTRQVCDFRIASAVACTTMLTCIPGLRCRDPRKWEEEEGRRAERCTVRYEMTAHLLIHAAGHDAKQLSHERC